MTSSRLSQSKMDSERAAVNTRTVNNTESRCTYLHDRRERNQIYTLLNISESANEDLDRPWKCAHQYGTGWEEAVQDWGKTPPFAYLQLQKRARRTRTSEAVGGCLYCLDMIKVPEKRLAKDPKTIAQPKSGFKLSSCALHEEKKKISVKQVQAALTERRNSYMKDSQLMQPAGKIAVPIKEYNMPPLVSSETTATKSSLPPLKDSTHNSSLDPSSKKSKTVISQAREKLCPAVSETVSRAQGLKSTQQKCDKGIDTVGTAVKMHEMASPVSKLSKTSPVSKFSKTSFVSRNSDRGNLRGALLSNRKLATTPSLLALRRNSQQNSTHTKGDQGSKGHEPGEPPLCQE